MTDSNETKTVTSRSPSHFAYNVRNREGGDNYWLRIGSAWAHTRKQALADGVQVDVSSTAKEAGIRFPVFITRTAFDAYVTLPPNVSGQDEAGRLWDVVWMLRFAIGKATRGQDRLPFALYVRNDNRAARLVKLIAMCGALDIDDPQPAITIMLPDED